MAPQPFPPVGRNPRSRRGPSEERPLHGAGPPSAAAAGMRAGKASPARNRGKERELCTSPRGEELRWSNTEEAGRMPRSWELFIVGAPEA